MALAFPIKFNTETSLLELSGKIVSSCENEDIIDFIKYISTSIGDREFTRKLIKELFEKYAAGMDSFELIAFWNSLRDEIDLSK